MTSAYNLKDRFDLSGQVAVITGGGGLLGYQHAAAIAELGGTPILIDISMDGLTHNRDALVDEIGTRPEIISADITNLESLEIAWTTIQSLYGKVDILINNAARNPKVETAGAQDFSRLECFPWEHWQLDLDVGLGGLSTASRYSAARWPSVDKASSSMSPLI